MGTKVKKYCGNNCHNNEVFVDYEKKTVRFRPVGKESLLYHYFDFLAQVMAVWFVRLLVPVAGISLILLVGLLVIGVDFTIPFFILLLLMGLSVLFVLTFSLNFWRAKWRLEQYPKFNYWTLKKIQDEVYLVVNKRAVIDRKFLLPVFENVGIKYEASGDFARHLQKIEVISLFDTDEGDWLCCFTFKEQPLRGRLKLRYI